MLESLSRGKYREHCKVSPDDTLQALGLCPHNVNTSCRPETSVFSRIIHVGKNCGVSTSHYPAKKKQSGVSQWCKNLKGSTNVRVTQTMYLD